MNNEIKTNYRPGRSGYPVCDGNGRKGWTMKSQNFRETDKEFFDRLVGYGYTRISFYEVTTRIKGLHELIAYVK